MEEIINVNKARLAVIIGHSGKTKELLEKKCKVNLEIDSSNGEIIFSSDNYFNIYKCKKIVKAISRGFSPKDAMILLRDDHEFEILHLKDYVGKHKKRIKQVKGRVIGKQGNFKSYIEKKFNCKLAIYGKTVSIIAKNKKINKIIDVIEVILKGSKHSTALKLIKKYTSPINEYKKRYTKKKDSKVDDISFNT